MLHYHEASFRSINNPLILRVSLAKKINYGERTCVRAALLIWNELLLATRASPSPYVFKSKVKTVIPAAFFWVQKASRQSGITPPHLYRTLLNRNVSYINIYYYLLLLNILLCMCYMYLCYFLSTCYFHK